MLKSIKIKKIKGIDNKTFKLDLNPNKPALLVAPNGFGKSSIAVAFHSMNSKRIALKEKDLHNEVENTDTELEIELNKTSHSATLITNEISKIVDVFVIKNKISAKSTTMRIGGFTTSSASLVIDSETLIKTIPKKVNFEYSISKKRKEFGANGKILNNASSLLADNKFFAALNRSSDVKLTQFTKHASFKLPLKKVLDQINTHKDSKDGVIGWIEKHGLIELEKIEPLKNLAALIKNTQCVSTVESYMLATQFSTMEQNLKFKEAIKYKLYLKEKEYFDSLLESFNTTDRYEIKTKETGKPNKKSLIVEFPKAHQISNGQRDILSFISQLLKASKVFKKENCILVIDEIFDYLDDGNLVAFQYYIIKFIDEFKRQGRNIYPLLLTHLDPYYFKSYVFSSHKMQVCYLNKDYVSVKHSKFLDLIIKRGSFKDDDIIDQHWFHYCSVNRNESGEFAAIGLEIGWSQSHDFYKLLNDEVRKYLDNKKYDPIAVLLGVRITIEQNIYKSLKTEEQRDEFIKTHTTVKKLNFASNEFIEVPDSYYLLGVLHNQYLHWSEGMDVITPIVSKLDNFIIKKLIAEVFS